MTDLLTRLFRWFGYLEKHHEVLAVTAWRPGCGPYGLEWPTMRIDGHRGAYRKVISPVWERGRILKTLRGGYRV